MGRQIENSPDCMQAKLRNSRLEVPLNSVDKVVSRLDCRTLG